MKRSKRFFAGFFLLCLLLAAFFLAFFSGAEEGALQQSFVRRPGYESLTKEKQELYDQVLVGIEALSARIDLGEGVARDDFFQVVEYILLDYPEIFWLSPQYEVVGEEDGALLFSVRFFYRFEKQEIVFKRWELEEKLKEINEKIGDGAEGLRFLHDYLIDHMEYDGDAADVYSALIMGKGNCQSYAKAFQLLCNRGGYDCITVTGEAGGVKHSWNLLSVDGTYVYADVTWDDPLMRAGSVLGDKERYRYFLIDEETLLQDHTLPMATAFGYPVSGQINE